MQSISVLLLHAYIRAYVYMYVCTYTQILRVAISMVLHQFSRTHKLPYKCVSAWRLFTAFCIRLLQQQLLGGGNVEGA